jgi:hypothetical protein
MGASGWGHGWDGGRRAGLFLSSALGFPSAGPGP